MRDWAMFNTGLWTGIIMTKLVYYHSYIMVIATVLAGIIIYYLILDKWKVK